LGCSAASSPPRTQHEWQGLTGRVSSDGGWRRSDDPWGKARPHPRVHRGAEEVRTGNHSDLPASAYDNRGGTGRWKARRTSGHGNSLGEAMTREGGAMDGVVGYAVLSPYIEGAPMFETDDQAEAIAKLFDKARVVPVINVVEIPEES